jgi:hypothetical protein
MSRLAYAYVVAGRHREFTRIRQQALTALGDRDRLQEPAWLYYLTPGHLDSQAGYALIHAGRLHLPQDKHRGRQLIADGETLLRTGVYDRPLSDPLPRRALYEGAWLALGCTAEGRLDEACELGRTAIQRLGRVRSARSTDLLRTLSQDMRRRRRNPRVRDFLPDLETALTHHAR